MNNGMEINRSGAEILKNTQEILKETIEVERHLHNQEKWFGLAAVPAAETHRADLMDGLIQPFALLSGNSLFGNWVQIIGSNDTPIKVGMTRFDIHRAMITTTDSTIQFIVQIATGEAADLAAKVAAMDYTSFPYISATNNGDSGISDVIDERFRLADKVWARCACVGQNAKTMNLYFGLHEYPV